MIRLLIEKLIMFSVIVLMIWLFGLKNIRYILVMLVNLYSRLGMLWLFLNILLDKIFDRIVLVRFVVGYMDMVKLVLISE